MKTALEIYEDNCWYDYNPMLQEFGNILLKKDIWCYSGDSYVIYESDGKYGYLNFGWGSCSGCDALQACDSINEVQELMDRLYNSIKWFDSLSDLKTYFATKDWELDYVWYEPEFKEFVKAVQDLC